MTDIKRKLIRAVGEPQRRFGEDALRILRGARFSARLGFSVDPDTRAAMDKKKELLRNVSSERIYVEWKKLLSADYAYGALTEFKSIISVFLPELSEMPLPEREPFEGADYMTRLVALFYLSGAGAEDFLRAMKRLKTDSHTAELGARALRHIAKEPHMTESDVGRLLYAVGEEAARLTLSSEKLLGLALEEDSVDSYILRGLPYRISDLRINGSDLTALGANGKAVGELLCELILSVIDGAVVNDREALLKYAKARIEKTD